MLGRSTRVASRMQARALAEKGKRGEVPPERSEVLDAPAEVDLVRQEVPVLVREDEPDVRVPAHAAERRLLRELDRLPRGQDDDGRDGGLGGLVRSPHRVVVVPEDQARVDNGEADLPDQVEEWARV